MMINSNIKIAVSLTLETRLTKVMYSICRNDTALFFSEGKQ